jgi:hypothetical protein
VCLFEMERECRWVERARKPSWYEALSIITVIRDSALHYYTINKLIQWNWVKIQKCKYTSKLWERQKRKMLKYLRVVELRPDYTIPVSVHFVSWFNGSFKVLIRIINTKRNRLLNGSCENKLCGDALESRLLLLLLRSFIFKRLEMGPNFYPSKMRKLIVFSRPGSGVNDNPSSPYITYTFSFLFISCS